MTTQTTIHASAVLTGDIAILIRGPSGSGKSRLALDLLLAGRAGQISACRLIGDDRVRLTIENASVIVSAVQELEGLIEVRGLGIRRCDFAREGQVGLVIDLNATDSGRMPDSDALTIALSGILIPRIPVSPGENPLPLVLAALLTEPH
jgi:HPr kinase/phosphorylase